jgi:hypothetical protein
MPSTDRTRDFFAHAETVRRRGGAPAAVEVRATAKASDFAARASECSRRFQQTSMKLAQLTKRECARRGVTAMLAMHPHNVRPTL